MNNKFRIQVSFDPETEPDIVAFINEFKKTERHCIVQSALRRFMTEIGFYQRVNFSREPIINQEETSPVEPEEKTNPEKDIIHMFDNYQQ